MNADFPVRKLVAGVALLMLVAIGAAACGGDDPEPQRDAARDVAGWPLANADRDNTRSVASDLDSSNVDDLGVAWRQELSPVDAERALTGTPLIVDEAVYVQDAASNVWAYDLDGGDELWRRMLREPASGPNGLAYENGVVFAATPTDAVALDADNGGVKWRTRVIEGPVGPRRDSAGISMAPMAADGRLLLGDAGSRGGGILASLDAGDGTEQWRAANTIPGARDAVQSGGLFGTPLVAPDDTVVVAVSGAPENRSVEAAPGALRAFDGETGELAWEYEPQPLQRISQPGPEPIDGTVPAPQTLDIPDPGIDLTLAPVRIELEDEDAVVIGGSDGVVRVVGLDDGVQLWSSRVGNFGGPLVQVAVTDGMVYAATGPLQDSEGISPTPGGELAAFDAQTGEQRWVLRLDEQDISAVTATNDLVLVAGASGTLFAVSSEDGSTVAELEVDATSLTGIAVLDDRVVVGGTQGEASDEASKVRPVVVTLALDVADKASPELSADVPDEADEVSDEPATNSVPEPAPVRPPGTGSTGPGSGGSTTTPPTTPDSPDTPGPEPSPDDPLPGDPAPDPDPDEPAGDEPSLKVVVAAGGTAFEPDRLRADAGTVRFRFWNPESSPHDFTILDEDGDKLAGTGPIAESYTYLEVDLEPGAYRFESLGDPDSGLSGTLVVT